jgi:crossover junction endonuclease MUS81
MIRLDPNEYINLRKIEFRAAQQSHLFAKQLKLVDTEPKVRDDSGMPSLFGFIVEEGAPPKCSKFWDAPSGEAGVVTRGEAPGALRDKLLRRQSPSELIILDDEGEVDLGTTSSPVRPGRAPTSTVSTEVSADFSFSRIHSVPLTTGSSRSTDVRNLIAEASVRGAGLASAEQPSTQSASADFSHPNRPSRTAPRLSSHIPALNPLADPLEHLEDAANFPDFSPDQAIIFPRGSYEILLIVDTREVESKTNRDKIAEALKAKGVKVETRALRLGDMCWVARRLDGLGGEEDECVLDYVVERKRLDDLCMSIKDGRYTEQCVRRTQSRWRLYE